MKKNCLLLSCFGAVFNITAAENTAVELISIKEKVNHAITKVEQTQRELWSYDISRYENEEGDISSSIEQHSPQSNERWLLKQINGQLPTKKQIKKFAKNKQEQSHFLFCSNRSKFQVVCFLLHDWTALCLPLKVSIIRYLQIPKHSNRANNAILVFPQCHQYLYLRYHPETIQTISLQNN